MSCDCEQFVQKQLIPIYSQLGPVVIDLQVVVPYGNARRRRRRINNSTTTTTTTTTIECQHGIGECDAKMSTNSVRFI